MALFTACEPEIETVPQISTDKGVYEIGADGGVIEVKLLATEDWTAKVSPASSLDEVDGITVEPASGSASAELQTVKINVSKNAGYNRAALVSFLGSRLAGALTVKQEGAEGERVLECTIAEFLKKPVDASVYYKLTGEIVSIANDLYSNFTLKDLDGDAEIYFYGLAYKEDISNQKVSLLKTLGITEGDILTVASTRGAYNGTPQGQYSYYISHEKSQKPSIKLGLESYDASSAGETFDLEVTSNKVTWTLSSDVDWLSFDPASGSASATVKVTVAAGEGGEGTITLSADGLESQTCKVVRASVTPISCAEFNALEDGSKAYQISGIVSGIVMDKNDPSKPNKYGNFYVTDATGTVYVYGLLPEKGGATGSNVITSKGIAEGDFIVVTGPKGSYKGSPQGVNMWFESLVKHISVAEFVALEDGDTPYVLSGKVANIVMDKNDPTMPNAYGNFDIVDESGSVYVYGLYEDYTKPSKERVKVFIDKGIKEGDNITLFGPKTTYNGTIEVNGSTYVLHESAGSDQPAAGIKIDGDMSDWAAVEGATGTGGVNASFKVASDATNIYFYVKRTTERIADIWGGNAYHYYCFDLDNNAATGVELWGNGPYELLLVIYPYAGSADAPAFGIAAAGTAAPDTYKVDNAVIKGVVTDSGVETEIAVPRADIISFPSTPVNVYHWSNKGGSEKLEVTCTL